MRILVIEDEKGISGFLKQGLEEESYAVDVADEGKHGLELALSGDYDLLLVDWMLPGMSGIEITRNFRKAFPDTPLIFLTAKDTSDEAVFALQAGANDYIRKPFHFEELLARIRVQLRPKSGQQLNFTLGPIVLYTENHRVEKDGKEVFLTQKEFALLEFLIRNKGKVCRRSRIIESVWNIHFEYDTGVIDVFINSIRKKLGLSKEDNYLQTIRGVGYMAQEI
ncbi:response regulator transcription factor [Aquiflexum gelatinilyticum]|uniref:Response regulator transcription factor n=1 Tax=Aquiflexum gelatinilyticum TaxID=2961943 RepID=A0A9X2SYP5_9BACT|nr:response regulator transcription factor [Aquiflexum gelatinilyticum]MCR9013428.1 response regulator transcription factor [Aquiflexum gelatinilyticum]